MTAVVDDIGHVLHEQSQGLEFTDVMQVAYEFEGFRVLCYLSELGPANAGKGLTGRPTCNHIHGERSLTLSTKVVQQRGRLDLSNIDGQGVASDSLFPLVSKKVSSMRQGGEWVDLHSAQDLKSSGLESQRDAATTRKEV